MVLGMFIPKSDEDFTGRPLNVLSFPVGSDGKDFLKCGRPGFDPWVRKIPWRREWQPTPVFAWEGISHD